MQIEHHHNPALLAGLSPPQKDEDLAGANGQVSKGNIKTDTSIVADLDADRKVFATLQARYAIAGFSLLELADGSLFASRCNL